MAKVCLVPRFRIRHGFFDAFLERVRQQRDDCLEKEPGCLHFDVLVTSDCPDEILLYEIYENLDAISDHRNYPHYKAFKKDTETMVESVDLSVWTIK